MIDRKLNLNIITIDAEYISIVTSYILLTNTKFRILEKRAAAKAKPVTIVLEECIRKLSLSLDDCLVMVGTCIKLLNWKELAGGGESLTNAHILRIQW